MCGRALIRPRTISNVGITQCARKKICPRMAWARQLATTAGYQPRSWKQAASTMTRWQLVVVGPPGCSIGPARQAWQAWQARAHVVAGQLSALDKDELRTERLVHFVDAAAAGQRDSATGLVISAAGRHLPSFRAAETAGRAGPGQELTGERQADSKFLLDWPARQGRPCSAVLSCSHAPSACHVWRLLATGGASAALPPPPGPPFQDPGWR